MPIVPDINGDLCVVPEGPYRHVIPYKYTFYSAAHQILVGLIAWPHPRRSLELVYPALKGALALLVPSFCG